MKYPPLHHKPWITSAYWENIGDGIATLINIQMIIIFQVRLSFYYISCNYKYATLKVFIKFITCLLSNYVYITGLKGN